MHVTRTNRGFEVIAHPAYLEKDGFPRLVGQSSGPNFDCPGSSFLWLGRHHHLSREEVAELVAHLQAWLETGSLQIADE